MTSDRWIVVRNWDRFQHPDVTRSAKAPLWIRNYTQLLHDPDYLELTLHQRGVLHGLWMEYATARRQIPDSTSTISRRLGERVTRATLEALNQAGFIEFSASKPQATRLQRASAEQTAAEKKDLKPSLETVSIPTLPTTVSLPTDWPEELDPAAAPADHPLTELQLTQLIGQFPDADRRTLNVLLPRTQGISARTVLETAKNIRTRRNPGGIGLLLSLLKTEARNSKSVPSAGWKDSLRKDGLTVEST